MTVAADLVAVLAPVGIPVRPPGAPQPDLPAILLEPAPSTFGDAGMWIDHTYRVRIMVAHGDDIDQLDQLEQLVDEVGALLVASTFTVEARIDVDLAGRDGLLAHHARILTVSNPTTLPC